MLTVELPIAWPVILTGIRVSTQMIVGIAAIVAYVLGPGLGSLIFRDFPGSGRERARIGFDGTIFIVIVALVFDALLFLLGRFTIAKGLSMTQDGTTPRNPGRDVTGALIKLDSVVKRYKGQDKPAVARLDLEIEAARSSRSWVRPDAERRPCSR